MQCIENKKQEGKCESNIIIISNFDELSSPISSQRSQDWNFPKAKYNFMLPPRDIFYF
jgi:hypothetical protein